MSRPAPGEGLSVTTPSDTELVLTRTFDASRPLVFDAFTRPELLRRWHGARGWHLVVCEIDLRPGGTWRFVSRGPDGAEMGLSGVYHEVEPPYRLVQTELHTGWEAGEALVTTVFDESHGRTTMNTTVRYSSREIRDSVLRTPMKRGAGEAYDRLAEVLSETTPKGDLE
ncbi:SRPBCC family protein [Planotetraspora kaengkrachanensis]|uniref:ATPase n=1 Tax=Planotetraspora kaengkrachanensis TaxID=575193 RepID=A0A8J3PUP1_9ACTN|nr:SRPBCC family protein [Planotetraspora kaengkrachanensis]GIG81383.1 ATPase [Planotetraspora kaengkrachanensis]